MRASACCLSAAAGLALLDQLLKMAAIYWIRPVGYLPLWPGILQLVYVENRGMAFSLLVGRQDLLIVVTGIAILALLLAVLFGKLSRPSHLAAAALMLGGGMGNLIDRIFRGYVIDYLQIRLGQYIVLNFADLCVIAATVLAILLYWKTMVMSQSRKGGADGSQN